MSRVSLSISCTHNAGSVARRLSGYPERAERALLDATYEATRHVERFFSEEMRRRAGGVYLDIDSSVSPSATNIRGVVSTGKNRPHRIEPTKPHGLLGPMVLDGRRMFVRGGVNHPGSRPIDVISPLRRAEGPRLRGIYSDHVRSALGSGPHSAMPAGIL